MHTLSIFLHINGKPMNCLIVRPTQAMCRHYLSVLRQEGIANVIGWQLTDKTGLYDSHNSSQVLAYNSQEFDSVDIDFYYK